ncbi:MAG TPA: hypothetical protein VME69_08915 [Methylocella sp.]|nr:hypothetical protein [Methylocella sp.]
MTKRGDHGYVKIDESQSHEKAYLARSVYEVEEADVRMRRQHILEQTGRDRRNAPCTGLSLSGGGIRSASFCLGVLQALQARHKEHPIPYGIEGTDYLSTVSGGGYIGNSLTTTLQKTKGEFPFSNKDNYDDTDAVYHIRDFSNYLIPHGALDVVTAIGVIGRGLVANAIIILPVLLFFVSITLLLHPNVASLGRPLPIFRGLVDSCSFLAGLPAYWLTTILLGVNLLFLFLWALAASAGVGKSASLSGGFVGVSKFLFFVTIITAFVETQPFILWIINEHVPSLPSTLLPIHQALHGLWNEIISYVKSAGLVMGSLATIFALFSKYLGDVLALAERATGWKAWFKKIAAISALWLAGLLVPFILWLSYLWLVDFGLGVETAPAVYLALLLISAFVALFINPNQTSLYGLYRDRLSKAFLFDPSGRPPKRDMNGDLLAFDPKLYEIDTNLCPYPIVNAALNIEASQFANRRGRNADFFMFTPEFIGSGATGYIGSRILEKNPPVLAFRGIGPRKSEKNAIDIGTAMAISGAALSANMGSSTIKALTFTLALLNIRLGYWLRNPNPEYDSPPRWGNWLLEQPLKLPSFLLFYEMFGWITEKRSRIYLTDGGHIENLGIYSLLKRRCKVILAVDAEADPTMSFGSLLILQRYARIDLGAAIDLPWQPIHDRTLAVNQAFANAEPDTIPPFDKTWPHCAAGEIRYGPNETGILLYIKASLTGDEDDYVLDYKRRHPEFPHETTSDQFFGEEQLEAYRALGFHIAKGLLTGETPFSVNLRPNETESEARSRILNLAREAFLGSDAKVPAPRNKKAAFAPAF